MIDFGSEFGNDFGSQFGITKAPTASDSKSSKVRYVVVCVGGRYLPSAVHAGIPAGASLVDRTASLDSRRIQ